MTTIALLGLLDASCSQPAPAGASGTVTGWGTAQRISPGDPSGDALACDVAMDPNGNATVIWYQIPEGGSAFSEQVWGARRSATGAWEPSTLLDEPAWVSGYGGRQVAMDGAGHTVAIWSHFGASVWASWSVLGPRWGVPERLTESGEIGDSPTVVIDPTGTGFALWTTRPVPVRILARRVIGGLWEPAQEIQLSPLSQALYRRVAVGPDGSVVVVWDGEIDGVSRIFSNRYRPGLGWGAAQVISPQEDAQQVLYPDVGVDALGNAVAVWKRFVRSSGGSTPVFWWDVVGRRFDTSLGWQEVTTIATSRQDLEDARVAVDPAGKALVVWDETSDTGVVEVRAARFVAASGWQPAQRLSRSGSRAGRPEVALDAGGNGLAVWSHGNGEIRAARFLATSGWTEPELVGPAALVGGALAIQVALALNPVGDGTVAWTHWDGTQNSIWVNRFTPDGSTPPK